MLVFHDPPLLGGERAQTEILKSKHKWKLKCEQLNSHHDYTTTNWWAMNYLLTDDTGEWSNQNLQHPRAGTTRNLKRPLPIFSHRQMKHTPVNGCKKEQPSVNSHRTGNRRSSTHRVAMRKYLETSKEEIKRKNEAGKTQNNEMSSLVTDGRSLHNIGMRLPDSLWDASSSSFERNIKTLKSQGAKQQANGGRTEKWEVPNIKTILCLGFWLKPVLVSGSSVGKIIIVSNRTRLSFVKIHESDMTRPIHWWLGPIPTCFGLYRKPGPD